MGRGSRYRAEILATTRADSERHGGETGTSARVPCPVVPAACQPAVARSSVAFPHRALPPLGINAQLKSKLSRFSSTPGPPRSGVERGGTAFPLMGRSGPSLGQPHRRAATRVERSKPSGPRAKRSR